MDTYDWISNTKLCNDYKNKLHDIYDKYYNNTDKKLNKSLLNDLYLYINIVGYIIGYRYLVSRFKNLFSLLNIYVEDYLDYRLSKIYESVKSKNKYINDISNYIYKSLQLSNQSHIYKYASIAGTCEKEKNKTSKTKRIRNNFFNIEENDTDIDYSDVYTPYEILSCDKHTIENDNHWEKLILNIDQMSYLEFQSQDIDYDDTLKTIYNYINGVEVSDKAKRILIQILDNWKDFVESDYNKVKLLLTNVINYSLVDYITYKYKNNELLIDENIYIELLKLLNYLIIEY